MSYRLRRLLIVILLQAGGLLSGCAVVQRRTQLPDDWYRLVRTNDAALAQQVAAAQQLYIQQHADSLLFTVIPSSASASFIIPYLLKPGAEVLVQNKGLDIDVFTIPFQVYPPRSGQPIQLNTNFNAALYIGQRYDRYKLTSSQITPWHRQSHLRTTGLGYGLFTGLGSTIISGDVTHQNTSLTYEGFVLHAGAATLYDAGAFNLGLAFGLDHLLGPDGRYWVHQHRPWFGVLFSVDLN